MKTLFPSLLLLCWFLLPCSGNAQTKSAATYGNNAKTGRYFATGGIKLYYEINGPCSQKGCFQHLKVPEKSE